MNKKIILIADSDPVFIKNMKSILEKDYELCIAVSFNDLKNILNHEELPSLAICQLFPEINEQEIINIFVEKKIPVILTLSLYKNNLNKLLCNRLNLLQQKEIINYIFRESPDFYNLIIGTVERMFKNKKISALIVGNNRKEIEAIKMLLQKLNFNQIFITQNHMDARKIILDKEIKLCLINYESNSNLKELDFLFFIRQFYSREKVGIIVITDMKGYSNTPIFLKLGANDFLRKPFAKEEFIAVITNVLENIELIEKLNNYAKVDPLTSLYNRRFFFKKGEEIWEISRRYRSKMAFILLDIDHFKKINDKYGHPVGDLVLKNLAEKLKYVFRRSTDLIGRIGGEEFGLLVNYNEITLFIEYLEKFRIYIEKNPLIFSDKIKINYTVSLGVETNLKSSLEEMYKSVDEKLYQAKNKGRNTIVY